MAGIPEVVLSSLPQSSKSHHVRVQVNRTRTKPAPPRGKCVLPLEALVGECDIGTLKKWDDDVKRAYDWLENVKFDPLPDNHVMSRNFTADDIDTLRLVMEPCSARAALPAFKIPKANGEFSRFLLNGRPANAVLKDRLRPQMPDLTTLLHLPQKFCAAFQADAKNWFYQLHLPERLRDLYSTRLVSKRGKFEHVRMKRLPMGASFAPAVAQACSRALINELRRRHANIDFFADVWLDNFYVFAVSRTDAEILRASFLQIADEVHATMKEVSEVTECIDLLGLRIDLAKKTIGPGETLSTSLRKAASFNEAESTPRRFLEAAAIIFFPNHIYGRLPLALKPQLFSAIQYACVVGATGWDQKILLPSTAASELRSFASALLTDVPWSTPPAQPETVLWVDASTSYIGALLQTTAGDRTYSWPMETPQTKIYLGELAAAWFGAQIAECAHVLASDNQAAVFAMHKGHATTRAGNELLAKWICSTKASHIAWVPTKQQRADYLSRPNENIDKVPIWHPAGRPLRWRKKEGGIAETTSFSSNLTPGAYPTCIQHCFSPV